MPSVQSFQGREQLKECRMDTASYLQRINYSSPLIPSAKTLRRLQVAHLLSVLFENLSIPWREPNRPSRRGSLRKDHNEKARGFCYELNGLFSALLRALGFDVVML